MNNLPLAGKLALVSGASRGIGKAVALSLGLAGAQVIGTATSENGAAQIQSFFKDAGCSGLGLVMDVTNQASIDAALEIASNHWGMPEILVNNAGIAADNLLLRLPEADWNRVIDANLTGVFRLVRSCLRAMVKARFGRIINIGSVVGTLGNPGQTNYAAAKAGLVGFSKSLAQEVGSARFYRYRYDSGFIRRATKQIA